MKTIALMNALDFGVKILRAHVYNICASGTLGFLGVRAGV